MSSAWVARARKYKSSGRRSNRLGRRTTAGLWSGNHDALLRPPAVYVRSTNHLSVAIGVTLTLLVTFVYVQSGTQAEASHGPSIYYGIGHGKQTQIAGHPHDPGACNGVYCEHHNYGANVSGRAEAVTWYAHHYQNQCSVVSSVAPGLPLYPEYDGNWHWNAGQANSYHVHQVVEIHFDSSLGSYGFAIMDGSAQSNHFAHHIRNAYINSSHPDVTSTRSNYTASLGLFDWSNHPAIVWEVAPIQGWSNASMARQGKAIAYGIANGFGVGWSCTVP